MGPDVNISKLYQVSIKGREEARLVKRFGESGWNWSEFLWGSIIFDLYSYLLFVLFFFITKINPNHGSITH